MSRLEARSTNAPPVHQDWKPAPQRARPCIRTESLLHKEPARASGLEARSTKAPPVHQDWKPAPQSARPCIRTESLLHKEPARASGLKACSTMSPPVHQDWKPAPQKPRPCIRTGSLLNKSPARASGLEACSTMSQTFPVGSELWGRHPACLQCCSMCDDDPISVIATSGPPRHRSRSTSPSMYQMFSSSESKSRSFVTTPCRSGGR